MKFDVLTIAVAVFVLGVLGSYLDLGEAFADEPQPPSALQQGITQR
ncbi:hypothetical protein G8770_19450 [Aestuariicella hydrocarbonica]|uniref:Uncharacterized protein n=1 Tax=Pseudomaricurvus hydrocarbonicus TaxID=1470433 RepID=A0A9E5T453_9GAMM|nr:hypothetical protein [Aestuariicella hydrocarbonica]NHO67728.1 hypothetical protein [Aestuariicella hydrocarbonica]